ncbi:MAG: hypothetical protein RBS37_01140 [Bacteroidales bacterium]|jgi:hypothetical protein|nr:hypothetical protein [Bacteroidales bacterium]
MKNHQIARFPAILAVSVLLNLSASAQIEGEFLKGGINDGMKLIEAYLSPWAKAFGAGFSGGWYNTAKPHSFGGFDITITVSAGMVPDSETTFDLNDLGFEELTLVNPSGSSIAPTIAGSSNAGPAIRKVVEEGPYSIELANFNSPPGTGFKFVPVPMAQVGIGLPLGSEITGRFIPRLNIEEGSIAMWGIGFKHSIMQYIPGNKLLPLDVSLFGGYTKLNGNYPLDLEPDSYANYDTYTFEDFTGQNIAASVEGWNASVIASVNLPVITFYGGLGYASSKTVIDIEGNIPLPVADPTISTTEPVYKDSGVITNVEGIEIEDFSGLRANLGFRLKFALFTLHADYTRSQYNVFTAGFGISFR